MDPAYSAQWTAQDQLGLAPTLPAGGSYMPPDAPPLDTVPQAIPLPDSHVAATASDAYTAAHATMTVVSSAGEQTWLGAGTSPVVIGTNQFMPQYARLSDVAFAPIDLNHRTWANLFHRQPPTGDRVPRPDWNPFATLRNFPMQAVAGLRTTIFGGPRPGSAASRGGNP